MENERNSFCLDAEAARRGEGKSATESALSCLALAADAAVKEDMTVRTATAWLAVMMDTLATRVETDNGRIRSE